MRDREIRAEIKKGLERVRKYYVTDLPNWWTPEDVEDRRIIVLTLWEILETLDAIERKL